MAETRDRDLDSDSRVRLGEARTIADDVTTVTFRKVYTPTGERLELAAPAVGHRIRLDAMELETLAWQDHDRFLEFVETAGDRVSVDLSDRTAAIRDRLAAGEDPAEHDPYDGRPDEDTTTITNEFAEAHVRLLSTPEGDRLEIIAPKLDYRIRLSATELESVTWQTTETFTAFLEHPFGPDGH
jgi:hypothetical protein